MKRKRLLLIGMVVMLLTLGACELEYRTPVARVVIGDEEDGQFLDFAVERLEWDGERYLGESDFTHIYKQYPKFEAPYVAQGTEIALEFGAQQPDSVTVTDDVLNSKGELMYSYMETAPAFETYADGVVRMRITKHVTSGRSCGFMANGTDYRGYRVTAVFGDEAYAYTFILLSES